MTTLEPGVYEPVEAPWWEFTCRENSDGNGHVIRVMVKQWMGEAARAFAQHLANLSAGGTGAARVMFTTLDGITGHYEVTMDELPSRTIYITVERGGQVKKPDE